MKATIVESDIPGLIGVVIGEHEIPHVDPNQGREKLQLLFAKSAIEEELRPFKAAPVGQSCPDRTESDLPVYLGI